ncbi:MAG TPA: SRPBCC family protein, partial [Acidimicrobiales bacterium]
AFVCPYHGWTYGLDGSLRHLPHAHGFPPPAGGDGEADRALVRVAAAERHGFVVVDQHAPPAEPLRLDGPWDEVAGVVTPDHRLEGSSTSEEPVNWKLMAETFLEGLHIRFLHRETFFPLQYDNVTVVEDFGPHSRVAFPYRALARLADVPPAERTVDGRLTYVYHLFPNVMVATFPGRRVLVVGLEPLAVDRTRVHIDGLVAGRAVVSGAGGRREGGDGEDRRGGGGPDLVARGGAEDFTVARSVQRGLAAGANTHLEFGLFEGAIAHFHRMLDAALADLPAGAAL